MNKTFNKILLISGSILLSGSVIALPFSLLSVSSNSIVIGNFQSYMSPEVMDKINDEYNINWQYYSSNAEIPTYIKNKTLDLAVATNNMVGQLVVNDQIQKIDWKKLELKTPKGNLVDDYNDLYNYNDANDCIIIEPIWDLCKIIGRKIGIDNLLEYCIPYFCQDLVFGYNGETINELTLNSNFNDIFDYITNTNIDNNRFINGNSCVMMIKDARTVYDVCSLMMNKNINPEGAVLDEHNNNQNNSPTIEYMNSVYDNIIKKYNNITNKNTITLNSDSNIILNKFANNEIQGAFFYNGDAIYSLLGGDNISIIDEYSSEQIDQWTDSKHMIIPNMTNNFLAMDAFVINKYLDDSKTDEVYDIIKSLSLDFENEDSYTMMNFDYVNYTPCYSKIYNYVIDDEKGYFNECFPNNEKLSDLLIKLISIEDIDVTDQNIELPISNLAESNMNIAFTNFIDKI